MQVTGTEENFIKDRGTAVPGMTAAGTAIYGPVVLGKTAIGTEELGTVVSG